MFLKFLSRHKSGEKDASIINPRLPIIQLKQLPTFCQSYFTIPSFWRWQHQICYFIHILRYIALEDNVLTELTTVPLSLLTTLNKINSSLVLPNIQFIFRLLCLSQKYLKFLQFVFSARIQIRISLVIINLWPLLFLPLFPNHLIEETRLFISWICLIAPLDVI